MHSPTQPAIRPLDRTAIHALLARNHVGRLAYSRGNVIDIEPVYYVYSEGWIYGRTSRGVRIDTMVESWWPVVFHVDEVDGRFDWRSVVVHGGFYTLSPEGSAWERAEYEQAVTILNGADPETLRANDSAQSHEVVFRIAIQEVSGRAASCVESVDCSCTQAS